MTSGEKPAILRAIPKLFARWQMTEQQSSDLLGVSRKIWNRIRAGHYEEPLTEDQALRALALIGIHVALRMIFTKPRSYNWIMRNNRAPLFAGQSAMDVVIAGVTCPQSSAYVNTSKLN